MRKKVCAGVILGLSLFVMASGAKAQEATPKPFVFAPLDYFFSYECKPGVAVKDNAVINGTCTDSSCQVAAQANTQDKPINWKCKDKQCVPEEDDLKRDPTKPPRCVNACLEIGACSLCDVIRLPLGLYHLALSLIGVVAFLVFFWGGWLLLTSRGEPSRINRAQGLMKFTGLGVLFVFLAWMIVNTVLNVLLRGKIYEGQGAVEIGGWSWDNPCSYLGSAGVQKASGVKYISIPSRGSVKANGVSARPPGEYIRPLGACAAGAIQKNKCTEGGGLGCGPYISECHDSGVKKWDDAIQQGVAMAGGQVCPGVRAGPLIKAIMAKESAGQAGAISPVDAIGLMQFLPVTAQSAAADGSCGARGETIDQAWLKNSANAAKMVCLATKTLQSLVAVCGCDVRNLAAGYNGGPNACSASLTCQGCSLCSTGSTRAWECLWDGANLQSDQLKCNSGYQETRRYVPEVQHCYNHFS